MKLMQFKKTLIVPLIIIFACIAVIPVYSETGALVQKGTVYVPAYSSIYHSDLKWEYNLSITLSIHNVDLENTIVITAIDYYNTSGKLIHKYIKDKNLKIKPFETYNLGIKETDTRGGVGANFIVKWYSTSKVNRPVIETIMIGTSGQQGVSFTSRGVPVKE